MIEPRTAKLQCILYDLGSRLEGEEQTAIYYSLTLIRRHSVEMELIIKDNIKFTKRLDEYYRWLAKRFSNDVELS